MQIADFLRYLVPELRGCPDEMLRAAIIEVVQELCREGKVWRELQDPTPLMTGVRDYAPDVPAGARITKVSEAFCGGRELPLLTLGDLARRMPDWQTARGSSPAFGVGANDWGVINVYPLPVEPTESLTFRAEFEPLDNATALPDLLLQRYREAIKCGVKGSCMAMPNTPWSNPQLAIYWRDKFEGHISDAKIQMIHERNDGSIRVAPRAFG